MDKHYSLAEIARSRAMGGWGRNAASIGAAMKALSSEEDIAAPLLEIVRRINQAIDAWGADRRQDYAAQNGEWWAKEWERAVPFPGISLGDRLYACDDLGQPVCSYVVVGIDPRQAALCAVVETDAAQADEQSRLVWADSSFARTPEDAVRIAIAAEERYLSPLIRRLDQLRAALDAGQPYAHLMVDG